MAQRYSGHRRSRPFRRGSRAPRESRGAFLVNALVLWGVVAVATWALAPQAQSIWTQLNRTPEQRAAIENSVYYPNCDAARAAGVAPIYRGSPGYREGMDGDLDGIACEPHRY